MTLGDDGTPETVTVEMTIAEVELIASYVGSLLPVTTVSSDIWDSLVGDVVNRFWEDGVHGLSREVGGNDD